MIEFRKGNLLESEAQALVNTVNTQGIMGKGVALQFKKEFPHNTVVYQKACKDFQIGIGKLLVTREHNLLGNAKIIINFPTKISWRRPSEYEYIEEGLKDLVKIIEHENIQSIALPPLGAGNGGLNWIKVKNLIMQYLERNPAKVFVYEPSAQMQDKLKNERVKLTPPRAMLLSVLYDLVNSGEFVSEFAAEKVAYFLQRFGAKEFNLSYQRHFYGPYSGKVRHILHYLNGSYIMGYSDKDSKPFEALNIIAEGKAEVDNYLKKSENKTYLDISYKTKEFLNGFYSYFSLELLSSVDFIMQDKNLSSSAEILQELQGWNDRKKSKFSDEVLIKTAIEQIQSFFPNPA